MNLNALQLFQKELSNNLLKILAEWVNEKPEATKKVVEALSPAIMGALVGEANSLSTASNLSRVLQEGGHDGTIFQHLPNILTDNESIGVANGGLDIFNALFEDASPHVLKWVTDYAGVKKENTALLAGITMPLLMGLIGREAKGKYSGISGLMNLMQEQLPFIKETLPYGLGTVLGWGEFKPNPNAKTSSSTTVTTTAESSQPVVSQPITKPTTPQPSPVVFNNEYEEDNAISRPKWISWVIGIGVGVIVFWGYKSCNSTATTTESTALQSTAINSNTADTLTTAATMAAKKDSSKPTTVSNELPQYNKDGFLGRLVEKLSNQKDNTKESLTFDKVNFDRNTAKFAGDSKKNLDELVKIMKKYPNVKLLIVGSADGSSYKKDRSIAEERADVIKKYIVDGGIDKSRLNVKGVISENGNKCQAMIVKE